MEDRLISDSTEFFAPVENMPLNRLAKTTTVNVKGRKEVLRADRSLFARMAVNAQTREINIREMSSHPLGPLLWSLATIDGNLAKTAKSKLVSISERMW